MTTKVFSLIRLQNGIHLFNIQSNNASAGQASPVYLFIWQFSSDMTAQDRRRVSVCAHTCMIRRACLRVSGILCLTSRVSMRALAQPQMGFCATVKEPLLRPAH